VAANPQAAWAIDGRPASDASSLAANPQAAPTH
jgi:hypothetical protein